MKRLADVDQPRYDAYLRTSMAFNLQLQEFAMDLPDNLNKFPDGWTDPLELYGERLPELKAAGCNLDKERNTMKELVQKYDARSVWGNRHRLALVAKAMKDYPRK